MDKLFFFVNLEDKYGFHKHFFVEEKAFLFGLLISIVIGVFVAAAFYFGCCNSKTSMKSATIPAWIVALVLAGGLTYLTIDFFIVGKAHATEKNPLFYNHSFYSSIETYDNDQYREANDRDDVVRVKNKIVSDLDAGKDVRLPFDLGCVVYSIIFFYLMSIAIKGKTRHGAAIPHKWPN